MINQAFSFLVESHRAEKVRIHSHTHSISTTHRGATAGVYYKPTILMGFSRVV